MPTTLDNVIATGKATLKSVKARFDGLTGVFRTLAEHHGQISALMARTRHHDDKRADLWPRIRIELLAHERAEIRELYPQLRTHAATRELADRHDAEAKDLEMMIRELDSLPTDDADWQARFDLLADTVEHHAEEEEKTLFPLAQTTLGATLTKELDAKFLRAKHQIADQVR